MTTFGNVVNIRITADDLASAKLGNVSKAAGVLSAALTAAGVVSVKFASDLIEAQNKAQVVFGEFADTITDFAKDSAAVYGVSAAAANEYAGTLGTILQASGLTQQATAGMSVELVKLASDLSSFNNIPIDVALEKLRSGLVGEIEPLRSVGVLLNAAAVEAKAVELGLAEAGETLTEQVKVQARYAEILEQTRVAQGDSIRTADELAGSLRRAQAQFSDAAAAIGVELIPVATALVGILRDVLEFFRTMPAEMRTVMIVVGGVSAGFLALVAALGPAIAAMTTFGVVTNVALAGIPLAIAGITAGITLLVLKWDEVTSFIKRNAANIVMFLGPIGLAIGLIIKHFDTLKGAAQDVFNFMVDRLQEIIGWINGVIKGFNKLGSVIGQEIPLITLEISKWEDSVRGVAAAIDHTEGQWVASMGAMTQATRQFTNFTEAQMSEMAEHIEATLRAQQEASVRDSEDFAANIIASAEARFAAIRAAREQDLRDLQAARDEEIRIEQAAQDELNRIRGVGALRRPTGIGAELLRAVNTGGGIESLEEQQARLRRAGESQGLTEDAIAVLLAQGREGYERFVSAIEEAVEAQAVPGVVVLEVDGRQIGSVVADEVGASGGL